LETSSQKSIGFEIKHIAVLIGRAFHNQVLTDSDTTSDSGQNLTIMQSHIIGFIYEHENYSISQKDLEREYSRRRSTITGILKLMEKNEYITREYSKIDARVKIVTLTDKAIELHQQIVSKIETFNESLENGLTPEEIDTFYSIMDKVRKNLEQHQCD
jgi:DNA-binding MarR family transcriptional regulator